MSVFGMYHDDRDDDEQERLDQINREKQLRQRWKEQEDYIERKLREAKRIMAMSIVADVLLVILLIANMIITGV